MKTQEYLKISEEFRYSDFLPVIDILRQKIYKIPCMVSVERRPLYLGHYQKLLKLTDWHVGFEQVSPLQVSNERIRANNNLVGLVIDDPMQKFATIVHTRREVSIGDIVHELVHLAHPEWQIHDDVNAETRRVMSLKRGKI